MGGIMRDVTVRALPDLHIRDMDIQVGLAQGYTTGTACVKLSLDGTGAEKAKVSWELYDGRIRMEAGSGWKPRQRRNVSCPGRDGFR